MKAHEYIISKQTQWALNRRILLIGSEGCRGRLAYTPELNQNLFEPLDSDVCESFAKADGHEISGSPCRPAKMQAVHSSSALSVNVFQYWQKRINQLSVIATACGFCRNGENVSQKIVFEDKYPIKNNFKIPPNIDVVFHNSDSSQFKRFAVECKFSEAYSPHKGLKHEYTDLAEIWLGIQNLYELAKSISPNDKSDNPIDNRFTYLHAAQLIKHILGLKTEFGKDGFRLLYLWYDVSDKEGDNHRDEIEKFSEVARADGIDFAAMTYQELIHTLSKDCGQEHTDYIKYLSERYL